ncbi:DUF922 domain-containing protein [Rhizobium sp. LjRoot30]|uniref:DUF922 domain-containing Zn-dependent protease n=1 Tax=Rhizobium sp. LjRoot30 TaxID=3342320 RepID=UPI003ED060B2
MTIAHRSLGFIAALAFFSGLAGQACAETIISKSVSYFTIRGTTAEELDHELNRRGPLTKTSGLRHPGATRIKFGGAVTYFEKGGRCRIQEAKITLSTQLILPQWKNRKKAKPGLAMIWETLSADIKRHEERHAEIARNHARDMERKLMRLGPERSCEALQARVATTSKAAIDSHDRDQARFDRIEAANFEDRMMRLLRHRMKAKTLN